MTPEQKIAKVLKQIRDEAAINSDPCLMKFELNYFIVGAGFLTADEERRILLKLEKEGVIDVRLSEHKDTERREVTVLSSYEGEKFLKSPYYWVEIRDGFDAKYKDFSKYLLPEKIKKKVAMNGVSPKASSSLTIHGDFIAGDKVGKDKNVRTPDSSWLEKYWWGLLIPVIVLVLGFILTEGRLPQFANLFSQKTEAGVVDTNTPATTTPNLSNIFLKTNLMLDLEKENFLKDFENGPVYAIGAVFDNINSSGGGFIVRMTVERNAVGCAFNSDSKKELLLLKKDDKVNFYGIFTGRGLSGYGGVNPWYITDCVFLK